MSRSMCGFSRVLPVAIRRGVGGKTKACKRRFHAARQGLASAGLSAGTVVNRVGTVWAWLMVASWVVTRPTLRRPRWHHCVQGSEVS